MKRFTVFLLCLLMPSLFALAGAAAHAAPGPTSIVAHYKITKAGFTIGTVEEKFTRNGDSYRIVSETQTAGALKWVLKDRVTLSSTGKIGARGLEPAAYDLKRQGDASKNVSAVFDRAKNRIVSRHHDRTETFEFPVGMQDRISAMYQFAFDAPPPGEVTFWMSQGKEAEQYRYRKEDEESIKIGETAFQTAHYVRVSEPGRARAELWLAINQHYLPVRMIFEDSHGLSLEQVLVDIQVQ
ncbi:MAG: DUF3108 domain-containing protein [Betaproteobacteria bacterium]